MRPAGARRPVRRVLAAPDKFRGTASAAQVTAAIAAAARGVGADCRELPLADGGEGTLNALGGGNRTTEVTGPLGVPVRAGWRLDGDRAVIEMAAAAGLLLAGGPAQNDPVAASTRGVGELIMAAAAGGAREILVAVGGSASTDGGAGALEVLAPDGLSRVPNGVRLRVLADVRTRFLDAARVFAPQKGATRQQVASLSERLAQLRSEYQRRFGIDVAALDSSGAAGGLAGGLAAIGAELVDGFDAVADAVGLDTELAAADLVVTGEGRFDAQSLCGKTVGGVIDRAAARNLPVLVVCGSADVAVTVPDRVTVISLVDEFGAATAVEQTARCIDQAVARYLSGDGGRFG